MNTRRALIAAGAAFAASPAAALPIPLPFGGKRRAAPAIDLEAIRASTGAPALAAAAVTAKGFAFSGAVGRRRIDRTDPVSATDTWRLASNTKAMTAALYARYVEAGAAAWGARLSRLLPDLKLHEAWSEVRIDDLLAHRSGITDAGVLDAVFLSGARASKLSPSAQRTQVATVLLAQPPMRQPGGFEYANLNYVIAGAVIERVAEKPWEDAVAAELFRPLRMADSAAAPGGGGPQGHRSEDGRLLPVEPGEVSAFPAVLAPSGGVRATLDDYARFVRMFLNDGGKVLKPETLARLARPWSGGNGQYGMGWQVWTDRPWAEGPVLAHEGGDGFWRASVAVAPARELGFIAFSNAEAGGGAEACARAISAMEKAFA